jgi:hypothetical protein
MFDLIRHWLHHYSGLSWPVMGGLFVAVPALAFALGVIVVVWLPADYFVRQPTPHRWLKTHPVLRILLAAAKNVLGATLFLAGAVMALPLVPGPGLVFMLLGLGMVDFPGKRALERRALHQPRVLASVNKMRARFGKQPMRVDEGEGGTS